MAVSRKKINFITGRRLILRQSFFKGLNTLKDAHLIGANSFKDIKNFRYDSGVLTQANGISHLMLPFTLDSYDKKNMTKNTSMTSFMFLYRYSEDTIAREKLISCTYSGRGYVDNVSLTHDKKQFAENLTGVPVACNYNYNGNDVMLFSTNETNLYIYDGESFQEVENSPSISSICVHNERVFALVDSRNKSIWFSEEFDPTNWNISLNEAGFINMADELGRTTKIVQMPESIFIFRDYGITKLIAVGSQENFIMTQFYYSTSRIHPKSIAVNDNLIIFATQTNIMATDGSSIRVIERELENVIREGVFDEAQATICKNNYYLAFRQAPLNDKVTPLTRYNDTLIILNFTNGALEIIKDVDVCSMTTINTSEINQVVIQLRNEPYIGEFLTTDENYGVLVEHAMTKGYYSGIFNINDMGNSKVLEKMQLYTLYDIDITLNIDGENHTYVVKGGGYREINISKRFYEFSYSLTSRTKKTYILPPSFIIKNYS